MTGLPPAAVRKLLAAWGVQARELRCVSRGDGQVWRVRCAASDLPASGTPAFHAHHHGVERALHLRPDAPDVAEALDAQLDWQLDLSDHGLLVPRPVPTLDGRWRCSLAAEGGAQAVLMQWVPGRILVAGLRPVHLRRIGRFIAQLHRRTQARLQAGWRPPSNASYGPDLVALRAVPPRLAGWVDAPLQQQVARAAAALQQELATWPRDPSHWGWIHGDLHLWNLVAQGDRAGAIDFGDSGWGFLALDLAAVLQFLRQPLEGPDLGQRPPLPALREALFSGYAEVSPLPAAFESQVDTLHRLRVLNTLQWMLDDWATPSQRAWGPAFLAALPRQLG